MRPGTVDIPLRSELVPGAMLGYRWLLTPTERSHIAEMLGIDSSNIKNRGNVMTSERAVCKCCGKHSGLDDMVQNALALGIHCRDFMIDVLYNGPAGPSPSHAIACSGCGEQFEGSFRWSGFWQD